MRKRFSLAIYLISCIVTGTSAAVGLAYASYVYNRGYETPVEFNSGILANYFDGGNGTSTSPYLIETPDHLRNVQKLNVLGVFSENTYFKLSDDIPSSGMIWNGEDLLPIGSEDYPFYSQFNGNGKRINNLVVTGSQTNDIGMFGYVAMNSRIENFLLSSPTIKVTADNNPDALSTTNPFAQLFANETTGAPSLGLNLVQKSGSNPAYFTTTKTSLIGGTTTYQIYYKSTNESLLSYNQSNNRWVVHAPAGGEEGKYYPVQLSARVYGVYQNKIISYTLERWHINVTYNGNVNVADASNDINVGYWKTLNATTSEGMGPHKTYVGFFAGHLDGEALYLGLYGGTSSSASTNGKLIVQGRPVSSFSSLIGRTLNDNIKDDANASFASQDFDFDYIIDHTPYPSDTSIFTIPTNPTSSSGTNSYMNTMNSRSIALSKYYSVSNNDTNFMRFYPSINNGTATYLSGEFDQYGQEIEVTQDAISLDNKPLSGHVFSKTFLLSKYRSNFFLKNGIWMYLSSESATGWGAFFSRKTNRYEAKIRVAYVASGNTANKFQFLYNGWNPNAYGIPVLSEYVANPHWQSITQISDDEGHPIYDPNDYPVVQTNEYGNPITNRIVEYEMSFELNLTKFALSTDFHLMLGFGVGTTLDNSDNDYTRNTSDSNIFSNETFAYASPFTLRILKLDLFFTSLEGEYSRQMTSVDYLYSIPTYSTGAWSNWNRNSETRVYFDVGSAIVSPGTTATYRFYRSSGGGWSTSKVYGFHNIPTNSGWELKNTSGYSQAVLANGE